MVLSKTETVLPFSKGVFNALTDSRLCAFAIEQKIISATNKKIFFITKEFYSNFLAFFRTFSIVKP